MIDTPYFLEGALVFFGLVPFLRWASLRIRLREEGGEVVLDTRDFDVTIILPMRNEEYNARRKIFEISNAISRKDNASLIVVNSASTDRTEEFVIEALKECNLHPDKWKLISAERPGKSIAINLALDMVDSEFVIMSDSDSKISDGWLENFQNIFAEPDIGIVSGLEDHRSKEKDWRLSYRKRSNVIRIVESKIGSTPILEGSIIGWRSDITSEFRLNESLNADDAQLTFRSIRMGYRAVVSDRIWFSETGVGNKLPLSKSVRRSQGLSRVLLGNCDLFFRAKKNVPNFAIFHAIYLYVFFPWIVFFLISLISHGLIYYGIDGSFDLFSIILISISILTRDGRAILVGSYVTIISHCQFIVGIRHHEWKPDRMKIK